MFKWKWTIPGTNYLYSGQHGSFGYSPASIKNKSKPSLPPPLPPRQQDNSLFWQASRIYWWARVRSGQNQGSQECRARWMPRWPWLGMYLTPQPSEMSCFSVTVFLNSSALNLVNPHLEKRIFWRAGNLNLALWKASITCSSFCSLV